MTEQATTEQTSKIPVEFENFVNEKRKQNGGHPHFLQDLAKAGKDPVNETLDIVEEAWIKNKSLRLVAKNHSLGYFAIYRLLVELEPMKQSLVSYLQTTPRRKRFYNEELESSDYENVQLYIRRAKRDGLRAWKARVRMAEDVWKGLGYKDPENWTADEFLEYIANKGHGSRSGLLDAVRVVAPQFADKRSVHYIATGRFREKIGRRKKDIFGNEVKLVHEGLDAEGLTEERVLYDFHISLGAREGSRGDAGLCGLTWTNFKENFSRVDLYESKVRGGILWEGCPVDLFFPHLPEQMRALWTARGKPTEDKVFPDGYMGLLAMYAKIRQAMKKHFEGKLDPSLYAELTTLRPHDADKVHCNLLWEAEVPLEVVAGQYLGQGRGIGLCGRGWLDINTIKKYYLSLTRRSERFQRIRDAVRKYSERFNGGSVA